MRPASWSTACPDWERRIVARESMVPAPLFPAEAQAALEVFKGLRIVDVPGRPTFGEACEQYVFDWVAAIFGAYDAATGEQLITEFLLLISKKNIKSTLAAGIGVTALLRNNREENQVLVLAPTKTIAENVFTPALGMIRADDELRQILKPVEHLRTIKHLVTGAEMKVVAADAEIVGGSKAGFVIVEELWLFGKNPKAKNMLMEATGGLVSRPEGFVLKLTTHSDEAPRGVLKEALDEFRAIRDGTLANPRKLGLLYEFPAAMIEAEGYLDPANFYVTNPNLGRSVRQDWLVEKLAEAQRGEGEGLQVFLAKHLNVEIGMRLAADRWTGAPFWEKAADPRLADLDAVLARCEVVVAGVDGGGLDDLLGLCLIGREKGSKRWLIWAHAWGWDSVWLKNKQVATQLDALVAEGSLTRCSEPEEPEDDDDADVGVELTQDVSELVAFLLRVRDAGLFPERDAVGLDPAGVAVIVDELASGGFTDEQMKAIPQGYKLSGAIKGLAKKVRGRTARHDGSQLMKWCVGNVKQEPRGASAVAITKRNAGEKIDPVAAMFNAATLMLANPEAKAGFVYDEREMLVV